MHEEKQQESKEQCGEPKNCVSDFFELLKMKLPLVTKILIEPFID